MIKSMRWLWVAIAFGTTAGMASCSSCSGVGGGASKEDIALLPREAQLVMSANVARMRDTSLWRKVVDVKEQQKADYDKFVADCGLDPLKQIAGATLALPAATATTDEFAVVIHGTFDEARLVACARKRTGHDLVVSEYDGKKLYNDPQSGKMFVTFLDGKTVLAGGPEWVKKSLDLVTSKAGAQSLKDNAPLVALIKKVKTGDALWAVGLVPEDVRQRLQGNAQLSAAKSMKDVEASADFATGLRLDLAIDLASDGDAKEVAGKLNEQLGDLRKNPQVMLLGLASMLEAIKVTSQGPTFHLAMNLNQPQVDQLVERLQGLLKSAGGMPGMGPSPVPGAGAPPAQ